MIEIVSRKILFKPSTKTVFNSVDKIQTVASVRKQFRINITLQAADDLFIGAV